MLAKDKLKSGDISDISKYLDQELVINLASLSKTLHEGLLAMAVTVGLDVMNMMMEKEIEGKIGPKGAQIKDRVGNWYGTTGAKVTLGSRRLKIFRPSARSKDGYEIPIETWKTFSSKDIAEQIVLEKLLAGVSTRKMTKTLDPVGSEVENSTIGSSKSSISREFVKLTESAIQDIMNQDIEKLNIAIIMIDGIEVAKSSVVCALQITENGTKVPLGLVMGDTENKTVVKDLLSNLVQRGLSCDNGLLAVIDGAKALHSAVISVFLDQIKIQRCTIHKRRNVTDYLPKDKRPIVDKKLKLAFSNTDPVDGLKIANQVINDLKKDHPDAAKSLEEGLDEMFTVAKLKMPSILLKSLNNTNSIESMFSTVRDFTKNVKNWSSGDMKKRWIAAGVITAERSFIRIKGYQHMPILIAKLKEHAVNNLPTLFDSKQQVGVA